MKPLRISYLEYRKVLLCCAWMCFLSGSREMQSETKAGREEGEPKVVIEIKALILLSNAGEGPRIEETKCGEDVTAFRRSCNFKLNPAGRSLEKTSEELSKCKFRQEHTQFWIGEEGDCLSGDASVGSRPHPSGDKRQCNKGTHFPGAESGAHP